MMKPSQIKFSKTVKHCVIGIGYETVIQEFNILTVALQTKRIKKYRKNIFKIQNEPSNITEQVEVWQDQGLDCEIRTDKT